MKKITIASLFCLLYSVSVFGQVQMQDNGMVLKPEIQKLSFLVGQWEGEGWMMGRDGQRHSFIQTESVEFKLDSTAILIEGLGMTDGEVIHNAMAVLRFDRENSNYSFNSFLSTGLEGSFKAELIDDKLYWFPNENMRYIIELDESGQWFEIGEINQNGQWFQFFEMTLKKV